MQNFIYWLFILVTTLSSLHGVNSKNETTIEIIFVNDMQYGFYPIDRNGTVCDDAYDNRGRGGLARLAKSLELKFPPPTTTTVSTTSATETTTSTTGSTKSTITTTTHSNSGSAFETFSASDNIDLPSNTLFLNAGNYLHSSNNNWFDLLKYGPAVTALNSLPFSAIALGPDVLQYGEEKGMDFVTKVPVLAANVRKSSNEDLVKFKKFLLPGVNVTVIGFLGKLDKEKYYGNIKISDPKKAIEAEIKKAEGKNIFIAIGTADEELATEIAKIPGMHIVIYSGSNPEGNDVASLKNITSSSWIATTKPPSGPNPHGLIGNLMIQVNENSDISSVTIETIDYSGEQKATDEDITTIEKDGFKLLQDKKVLLAKTAVSLGGSESCIALECGLGDLVTDAMRRFMAFKYEDGVAMWNLRSCPKPIEANANFTTEELYDLLGRGNDENMYVVPLTPIRIKSLLEESVDNSSKNECSSLQISGLYVDYKSWESKGDRIKRIRILTAKGFQALDLKENKDVMVIVPAHLMNELNVSAMDVADLGTSVADTVAEYINHIKLQNAHFFLPPLGFRFTDACPEHPPKIVKCQDNVGEAVVLTLAVVVMIGALGLLTWYFIIPRIRQRRGSTMPLIY